MNDDEVFEKLSKFGLSPYEIKVYKTLLLNGPQTSTSIVSTAGIPQPRVYDLFNNLITKGLIEVSPGKKKIYRAVPVEVALSKIINEMTEYKDEISKVVEKSALTANKYNPYLWYLDNEVLIREQMKDMVVNSQNEIIGSCRLSTLRYLDKYLIEAADRGVSVFLTIFPDSDRYDITDLISKIVIKRRPGISPEIIIKDRDEAIVQVDNINLRNKYAIDFEEEEMIHIINYYYYNIIWKPSIYISKFQIKSNWIFNTSWISCEAINMFLNNGYKLEGRVIGVTQNGDIDISGSIKGTDIIPGYKNSFIIQTDEQVFSVGGRLTRIEDIRMDKFYLTAEKIK
ncbi:MULTISPECIES: TrmB family transcriptional regulator [Acidiplasma]|jgi:sugar-specific transcriptional regulator TrmB|uniref:Transcriptional regulator n=2 Tax=Acidiplasma TaxID=507753 RepID=A0A0Q0WJD8_9ARCH|nr:MULTISPECIES: TrmB family transcriptional regulator [Acidiplasma]KJE49277.1 transcriptional regulator [Acidiplasma sp. MBA-1]KPV46985.1 transcriptional regulator [Acidiplasma aeolicum]KQB34340.1 transcriptional regulator [Acidiplasma aeolicum]KQB35760.1 transcriptional regulator [Acidiplasma cupricumulans]WMT54747.1 MAG: TrmB family transcriptional regulator [Acidiplasma sp.]